MFTKSRKKKPLQTLILRAILLVSFGFLLVFGSFGFVLNITTTIQGYMRETTHSLEFALSVLDAEYIKELIANVNEIYGTAEKEGLNDPSSEEYVGRFYPLIDDERFWKSYEVMRKCVRFTGLDGMAIIIPDEDDERLIYIIDGYDIDKAYLPGQWISTSRKGQDSLEQIEKIATKKSSMRWGYGKISGWTATNYVKYTDDDGNFIAYATADINMNDFVNSMIWNFLLFLGLLSASLVIIIRQSAVAAKTNVIAPINSLARSAYDYTKRDKTKEKSTNIFAYNKYLGVSTEMETLSKALIDMERDINETMVKIREITSEKERFEAELSVATNIQEGVLRNDFPAFPDRNEFDVYASMTPAKEVGGDLYDFFLIDDDHLCLVIGDVSGKSVPAALFMLMTIIAIRNVARAEKDIVEIINKTNRQLCQNNKEFLFVTLWIGIYTISEKKMSFVNAGHEDPVVYRASEGKYSLYETIHDIPLGIDENAEYKEDVFKLKSGDKLFLYTDGLLEATRADDAMYGDERMIKCLNADISLGGEEIISVMKQDVDKFLDGAAQFDDLTMLYFEVK